MVGLAVLCLFFENIKNKLFVVDIPQNCLIFISPETTTHPSRPTSTSHFTTKLVTIGPQASAKKTYIGRGTSTVINTPLWLTTTQNISTKSIRYSYTLPKQSGVPVVAVVVPSTLLSIGVGIGIFIICRKRYVVSFVMYSKHIVCRFFVIKHITSNGDLHETRLVSTA